jgi:hypothetical protein
MRLAATCNPASPGLRLYDYDASEMIAKSILSFPS